MAVCYHDTPCGCTPTGMPPAWQKPVISGKVLPWKASPSFAKPWMRLTLRGDSGGWTCRVPWAKTEELSLHRWGPARQGTAVPTAWLLWLATQDLTPTQQESSPHEDPGL